MLKNLGDIIKSRIFAKRILIKRNDDNYEISYRNTGHLKK